VRNLDFRQRLLIQALVALWMVFVGGVELGSLGVLLPGRIVDLGWLAVPMTVFATIGLIKCRQHDRRHRRSVGIGEPREPRVTAFIAHYGGNGGSDLTVFLIVALIGGLVGFLHFNLRYPGHPRRGSFSVTTAAPCSVPLCLAAHWPVARGAGCDDPGHRPLAVRAAADGYGGHHAASAVARQVAVSP
jgi:hypothetical protein